MQRDELLKFLTDITADRLAILHRHEASARVVSHYDFNNTYQYVISREETHLQWLQNALVELGVGLPQASAAYPAPEAPKGKKAEPSRFHDILEEDGRQLKEFVDRWRPRVEAGTFGLCRDCGQPIADARLDAIPWTRVCITCKEKQKA